MEGETTYWMKSLFTKLVNSPIYAGLLKDLVPLANDFFRSSAVRGEMNFQARVWKNHVRELVFDIEDWVDQKPAMVNMGAHQLEIEDEANKFKAQIEQARELYARYNLFKQLSADLGSSSLLAEERSEGVHYTWRRHPEERRRLRIPEQTSHLEEHLLKPGEMMLKVSSIFGMEGSGKTSLAKEIYGKLQEQFECQAFVSVGRRASMRTTLLNILRQVKPGANSRDTNTSQDLHKVQTELWDYLGTKRYFIVLDGLWSKQAWKVINCALPDKNCGSRVLTTTCIIDVAQYCSMHSNEDFYTMNPLSQVNSKILLQQSLRAESDRTLDDIHEHSAKLLQICGGMPLAIIVAAGLLYEIPEEGPVNEKMDLKYVHGSLERKSTSEGMAKILDMSYAVLCLPLKSCFLYLSVFPEEYTIRKDRLIWLWRAEGFIQDDLFWIAGEKYFDELIIRGLIQPVFNYDDDKAVGCTVHGVIRDFIRSLSREENFVTLGADLGSGIFPCSSDTVRRFSLDSCNDRDEAHILASSSTHLLSMRSLTVFEDTEEKDGHSALAVHDGSPVLPWFKLIRVLDLEDAHKLRSHHLIGMEGLILLKYLGLRGTGIDELPRDIGKLEHMEVLDVRQTKMSTLPASIVGLKRLKRLLLDGVVKVPCNINEMEGLEEVSTIGADSVMSFLGGWEPRQLRVLGVCFAGIHNQNGNIQGFLSFICYNCEDLLSVSLFNIDPILIRALTWISRHPHGRRKFEVTVSRPIPSYALRSIASTVTHLHMEVTKLTEDVVLRLKILPCLELLKLVSAGKGVPSIFRKRTRPKRCIIRMGHFVNLEVFWFTCKSGGMELQFESEAVPRLRRLRLCFSAWETLSRYGDFAFGIQHLKGLVRVHAAISCKGATVSEVEKAEAAIREQAREAGASTIELRREFEDEMLAGERLGLFAKTANRLGLPSWNK